MYQDIQSKRILAKGIFADNDTWATGLNNNDLVVGPSGGGKTRGYVVPNILHTQESLIVADTKGNLCRQYGRYLEKKGYKVMHLDFTDTAYTPGGITLWLISGSAGTETPTGTATTTTSRM